VPPIHKPHWEWLIVFYFFFGGLTSGSYVIATIAEWFGGAAGRPIARVGRYVSFAALLACPPLLILDLGRPERFHHMLRVFKLRSPMSVGVWGLLTYSGFCTLSACIQAANDCLVAHSTLLSRVLRVPAVRLVSLAGIGSAFFLGGYTGVLLAATAVPLWARNALLMGPLFLTSALSSSTAAIALVLALLPGTPRESLKRLERFDTLALLTELVLVVAVRLVPGPVIGRPLTEGRRGLFYLFGVIGVGILAPAALQWPSLAHDEAPSRPRTILASIMVLIGGLLLRYVMVFSGRRSADDPAATFAFTAGPDPTTTDPGRPDAAPSASTAS
jgi:formate-dependent nitrite reductase membrane component NrfD